MREGGRQDGGREGGWRGGQREGCRVRRKEGEEGRGEREGWQERWRKGDITKGKQPHPADNLPPPDGGSYLLCVDEEVQRLVSPVEHQLVLVIRNLPLHPLEPHTHQHRLREN